MFEIAGGILIAAAIIFVGLPLIGIVLISFGRWWFSSNPQATQEEPYQRTKAPRQNL